MRRIHLLAALVLALCAAAFLPGIGGPFILDDHGSVVGAKPGELSAQELVDIAVRDRAGMLRRPLSNLSFTANHLLARDRPLGFKLTNLAIHWLCGFLLFVLARRLLARIRPDWPAQRVALASLVAAAIWVAHPLQVSTTLYIVQRMAQLGALFSIVALVVFAGAFPQAPTDRERTPRELLVRFALYALAGLLALLSKETGVLIPLLAAVCAWTFADARADARDTRRFLLATIGAPLAIGAVGMLVLWDSITGGYSTRDFTLVDRLLTQPGILLGYLRAIFWPDPALMGIFQDDVPIARAGDAKTWLAVAAILAMFAAAVLLRRRAPIVAFACGWFLAAHALESTFVPLELVFEHRNYLALFGPAMLVAWPLSAVWSRPGFERAVAAIPVLVLAGLTMARSHTWSSNDVLMLTEFRNHPHSLRALMMASSRAVQARRFDEAERHIATIQSLAPQRGWPLLLDAHLQCSVAGHPVDWAAVERHFRAGRINDADYGMLQGLAGRMLVREHCPHGDRAALAHTLEVVRARLEQDGAIGRLEEIYVLQSYLAKGDGDYARAAQLLDAGARAHPAGTIALFDLALLQLNHGMVEDVPQTIARLREVAAKHDYPIDYQIDEIEGFLAAARRDAANAR